MHLFLPWNVSSLKNRSQSQQDYLNMDQTKANSLLSNKLWATHWENTDMSVLGSHQGRSQLSYPANSNRNTHFSYEILLIFSYFSEGYMTAFPCLFLLFFFSLQLSDPILLSSTPSSFLLFLSLSVKHCWVGSSIVNVFQVSAQQHISNLYLQQAAAPRAKPHPPPPHPSGVVHVLAGIARERGWGGGWSSWLLIVNWSAVFVFAHFCHLHEHFLSFEMILSWNWTKRLKSDAVVMWVNLDLQPPAVP